MCRQYKNEYLIIILCLALTDALLNFDLPEELYDICPYTDICNRTSSKSLNIKGRVPCCTSCKCDNQCGLRLDCCFDHLDKYRLKDKGKIECFHTFFLDITSQEEAYWMIQSCNITAANDPDDLQIPCNLHDDNGQSVIKPVSSKETGNIYVNAECAECNNVHNFTKWDYLLLLPNKIQFGALLWELEQNLGHGSEISAYIPPDKEDWSMSKCFIKTPFIDKCNANSTFESLCRSFRAFYHADRRFLYRNVFCASCSSNIQYLETDCGDGGIKSTSSSHFTVLMDQTIADRSKLHKMMSSTVSRLYCPKSISISPKRLEPCVRIYCPEGMLNTPNGCKYMIRRFYIPAFLIQFKLVPVEAIELPIATLKELTAEELSFPLLWINLPCQRVKPTVLDVFFGVGNEEKNIKSLIVRLWKLTPNGIDVKIVVSLLKKCLIHNWHLQFSGNSYPFNASLDMYADYIQDGIQKLSNPMTKLREAAPRPQLYERIVQGSSSLQYSVRRSTEIFRKVYFCNQVRLPVHDVEVLAGEILILSRNKTFGNNEFTINYFREYVGDDKYRTDFNKTTFSVCLKDYDDSYDPVRSLCSMTFRKFLLKQLIIGCAFIHIFAAYLYQ